MQGAEGKPKNYVQMRGNAVATGCQTLLIFGLFPAAFANIIITLRPWL